MIASIPFILDTFKRFNALCFESSLPDIPIVLTKAGSFIGKLEYSRERGLFGLISSNKGFRMKISTSFDLQANDMEDVVLHEMIHYYIALRNIRDTSTHGKVFRHIMETINREHGRHITVTHHGIAEQNLARAGNREIRVHSICVSTFTDGKVGITVCSASKISEIRSLLPKYYMIAKTDCYESSDSFFNRYPRSHTPKIYRISKEDLHVHLKDAVSLKV